MLASTKIDISNVNAQFNFTQPEVDDSLVIQGKIVTTENISNIKFLVKPRFNTAGIIFPLELNNNTLRKVNNSTYLYTYMIDKNLREIVKNNSVLYVYENNTIKGFGKITQESLETIT